MEHRPVILFGAGATAACGVTKTHAGELERGPLTNEILPQAFISRMALEGGNATRQALMLELEDFLVDRFNLPKDQAARKAYHYPGLPLLISLIDTSLDRKNPFGTHWSTRRLARVRKGLEFAIFALLEYKLRRLTTNPYHDFLEKWRPAGAAAWPVCISLNYDIILDNTLIDLLGHFPNYGSDLHYTRNVSPQAAAAEKLLKIHGSLNWLYCPCCLRLELGVSRSGQGTYKVLAELVNAEPSRDLDAHFESQATPCTACQTPMEAIMITPTHLKDYRNPHIARVWYEAERALQHARHVYFIGYSLPEDDVDVIYLLKKGLHHLGPKQMTVVEYSACGPQDATNEAVRRYQTLFGRDINWTTAGFGAFVHGFTPPQA